MALIKLDIPAGAFRNTATELETGARWRDMSLIRFSNNVLQAIGGWRKRIPEQLSGKARAIKTWRSNLGARWIAIGSNTNLYAINGGGTLFDITPTGLVVGYEDAAGATGYGVAEFGEYEFGVSRPETAASGVIRASSWSLDNWGQNLVGVIASDGRIFEWDLAASEAAVIANAPTNVAGIVVSEERIMFAYGSDGLSGDDRLIQWCDQEDNTTWAPLVTNQAGSQILQTNGRLVGACRVNNGTLFVCDTEAFIAAYVGSPFVFRFDRVGSNCGLVAQNAIIQIEGTAIWMGIGGFWQYNGSVSQIDCPVSEYVYGDINKDQISKCVVSSNNKFQEITFWYPSGSSNEVDRYVNYNYRTLVWSTGYLGRTCSSDGSIFGAPIAVSPDGYVYDHEIGVGYDGALPYVESGPIEIGQGDNLAVITNMIPDASNLGDATVTFTSRFWPTAPETAHGPYSLSQPTSLRFTGRQVKMKITGTQDGWRVGDIRVDVKTGGKR